MSFRPYIDQNHENEYEPMNANTLPRHLLAALAVIIITCLISSCSEQKDKSSDSDSLKEDQIAALNTQAEPEKKTTLFVNGNIYTVNTVQPKAQAIAVQGATIVAVGGNKDLIEQYPNAKRISLKQHTVVPGFIDAHGHLLGLGQSLLNVDLTGTTSEQDVIQRLKAREPSLADGQWLIGRGWDQNDWPNKALPTKAELDSAFPNRAVWLERIDGHASWGNSVAMAFAERDLSGEWQIDGGEIVRDESGQATGVFIDKAAELVQSRVPNASDEELMEALRLAMRKTASVGLTSMHDAGTSLKVWRLLEQLKEQNKLDVRVYAMADGANEMLSYLCENGRQIDKEAYLTARSIKLYSDGALGSRGAALIEDYSDDPGNKGLLIEPKETLDDYASRAANCGLQVNIHAIGDRGNRITLDVLTNAAKAPNNEGRHRIEHSQVIEASDFERFKQLGLIASVQPTHATSDMYWAEDRVGAERIKGAYAWQTFRENGVPLALGSDFPVERPDPLHGFYAAVSRQDHKGWPKNGWYASQALSREDALYGFTLGAAYAAFQESQLGSIEVGKLADFTVLSKDIMQIPVAEIITAQVVSTYIDGQEVYKQAQ